jgi:hypothetical protein
MNEPQKITRTVNTDIAGMPGDLPAEMPIEFLYNDGMREEGTAHAYIADTEDGRKEMRADFVPPSTPGEIADATFSLSSTHWPGFTGPDVRPSISVSINRTGGGQP